MPLDLNGSGKAVANSTSLPTPLFGKRPPADLPPVEALGPLCGTVEAIAELTQAPIAIAMQSVLSAASLATQGFADVELLHGRCPISLFQLTVAESGERKSTCDSMATEAVSRVERERRNRYERDFRAYNAQKAERSSAETCVIEPSDPFAVSSRPLTEPREPSLTLVDATIEGIINQLRIGTPSIGIMSDEGGQVLGGYAMKSENKLKSSADLSKFWDGASIRKFRASSPPIVLSSRRVTLHLMMQPGVAQAALGDAIFRDQGFLSRTLVVWPDSRIGRRFSSENEASQAARREAREVVDVFGTRITELLNTPLPTRPGNDQELDPGLLCLSKEARRLLLAFYNRVEAAQQEGQAFATIRGFASKAVEQGGRIAAVLTLFADPHASEVSSETMSNALNLMDWYLGEALRILDTASVSQDLRDAETLRCWLIENRTGDAIDVRTTSRLCPNRFRTSERVKQLFAILEEHGWLVPAPKGTSVGDAIPRKVWWIVRPGSTE